MKTLCTTYKSTVQLTDRDSNHGAGSLSDRGT